MNDIAHTTENNPPPSRLIVVPIMTYWILGLLIIYLDLGQTSWGFRLANLGWDAIPSVSGTAVITTKPHSAALVLILAWLFIPIMYVLVMAKASSLIRSFSQLKPGLLINISSWAFSLVFVVSILFEPNLIVPHETGLIGRKVLIALSSSDLFVVVWGFVILAVGWMVMLFMTLSAISFFQSFNLPKS